MAVVEEQDTHLLLKIPTTIFDPGKPAWYLANKIEQEQEQQLGEVIIKGKHPIRLMAVVHNIEHQPTCKQDSIIKAYQKLWRIIVDLNIYSLAIPLLGTVHGHISINEAIDLFHETIPGHLPACLNKIWLILPEGSTCEILTLLRSN